MRIAVAGAFTALPAIADAWHKGEAIPWWVVATLASLSMAAVWLAWILRGEILTGPAGIGFRFRGRESWIEWDRIEAIERRRLAGEVRVLGAGREIRFNDQLIGYPALCSELAARAPQWTRQEGLQVPFEIRASAMSWVVLALLVGTGGWMVQLAAASTNDPLWIRTCRWPAGWRWLVWPGRNLVRIRSGLPRGLVHGNCWTRFDGGTGSDSHLSSRFRTPFRSERRLPL